MTAANLGALRSVGPSLLILSGLAASVAARWAATISGAGDGVAVGLVFGIMLVLVAVAGGQRLVLRRPSAAVIGALGGRVLVGAVGGAVLVGLALAIRGAGPWLLLGHATAFPQWALVTVLVASAEELVLRGVLFDVLDRGLGTAGAVVLTSVAFALMHVPLYGWHVLPLDLGVGFWLAGLRLVAGGVTAPAFAHVVADLATWWL